MRILGCMTLLTLLVPAAAAQYPGAVPVPVDLRPGFEAITTERVREALEFLAGPEAAGRKSDQPGFAVAAGFAASQFRQIGLKPLGDNGSFFQKVTYRAERIDPASVAVRVKDDPMNLGQYNKDYLILGPFHRTQVTAAPVFVHIPGPEARLPADLGELHGKILIVDGPLHDPADLEALNRAKPAVVLFVVPQLTPVLAYQEWIYSLADAPGKDQTAFTVGHVSQEAANRLAARAQVEKPPEAKETTLSVGKVELQVAYETEKKTVETMNVVGLLRGTDPALKAEVVTVGANLDHHGVGPDGVHPGADRNASGAAAVLTMARAMAHNPVQPRRGVLFVLFTAGELGGMGSKYFVEHPPVPLAQMVAYLGLKAIGRTEAGPTVQGDPQGLYLAGSQRRSPEFHRLLLEANNYVGFKLRLDSDRHFLHGDHLAFDKKEIPAVVITAGHNPDTHEPTDTAEKVSMDKVANAARWIYLAAAELAQRDQRPAAGEKK